MGASALCGFQARKEKGDSLSCLAAVLPAHPAPGRDRQGESDDECDESHAPHE